MARAVVAVAILFFCIQLFTFYTDNLEDFRCSFYSDDFAEKRQQNLANFVQSPMSERKLSYCSKLLESYDLHPRVVKELREGNFNNTPMFGTLIIVCESLEDSRFLLENHECTRKFKVRPWEAEAKRVIELFNTIFPLWFSCVDNIHSPDCEVIQPYLASFQKLTRKF